MLQELRSPAKARGLAFGRLPSLFACESLVQKCKDFRDVELHVFQIKIILVVFLHLKQVVELEV